MARRAVAALAILLAAAWADDEASCDANAEPDSAGACRPNNVKKRESVLLQARSQLSPHEGKVDTSSEFLGCFPRSPSDVDNKAVYEDLTCVNYTNGSKGPCRSGLPFFRFILHQGQSELDCYSFCLSKGMDLSGITPSAIGGGDECRCGATPPNEGIWGTRTPPAELLLPKHSVPEDDKRCVDAGLLVWQYTGGLENGTVPTPLLHLATDDLKYIDAIAHHKDPKTIMEEDEPDVEAQRQAFIDSHPNATAASLLGVKGVCEDLKDPLGNGYSCSQSKNWCNLQTQLGLLVRGGCPFTCGRCTQAYGWLSCYPKICSPGGGPWPTKSGNTVYINYYFTDRIDAVRQETFRKAQQEWESKTCVKFVYKNTKPVIKVDITNYESCSSNVGYPGPGEQGKPDSGVVTLNMGWCKEVTHWGNVAHELGHSLGMNHEQNREDGAGYAYAPAGWKDRTYTPEGWEGPYLRVKWGNIDLPWRPFWQGEKRSYIGSNTAGTDDQGRRAPGYAKYDYNSLMHYQLDDYADIASGHSSSWKSAAGQRDGLSAGDIAQFTDMYQCGATTQGSSTPVDPGPEPAGCADGVNPWGQSCAAWKSQGHCPTSNGIQKHCKKTCGTFECANAPARQASSGRDCADATGLVSGQTCKQWVAQGACDGSNTVRRECPYSCTLCNGNCWDSLEEVYGAACHMWRRYYPDPICAGNDVLNRECPHSCGMC